MAESEAQRVSIGVVAKAHGVRGEFRVHLHNPESTAFDSVDQLFIGGTCYQIRSARQVKGGALVVVEGLDDRNAAEALAGKDVVVARDELELEEDDVLLDELVGITLVLADGSVWGQVSQVIAGVQDILVVHSEGMEKYLPLVDAFVTEIDLDAKRALVKPPEDLPEWEA